MSVKAQRKKQKHKTKMHKFAEAEFQCPKMPPEKGGGEVRVEARILQTNVLYSIQGPCFMDNESPA
jgi:hypothetical protein